MATANKRINFFESEEGLAVRESLKQMTTNNAFRTGASYSANTIQNPTNSVSFIDKHMRYLSSHPSISTDHYLANLRLITRIR
jgi:hypothetical protein